MIPFYLVLHAEYEFTTGDLGVSIAVQKFLAFAIQLYFKKFNFVFETKGEGVLLAALLAVKEKGFFSFFINSAFSSKDMNFLGSHEDKFGTRGVANNVDSELIAVVGVVTAFRLKGLKAKEGVSDCDEFFASLEMVEHFWRFLACKILNFFAACFAHS